MEVPVNTKPKGEKCKKWGETFSDNLLIYSIDDANFEQSEEGGWHRNTTIYDFTTLIRRVIIQRGYVAVIEDETLAVKGWFPAVLQALGTVQQRSAGHEWISLRLFNTERLLGWDSEERPRFVALCFLVWALLTCVMFLYRRQFDAEPIFLPIHAIWLTSFILSHRNNLLHSFHGRPLNRYGCCSQGLVFPRQLIPRFLAQTDLMIAWLVDMMVEKVADNEGWSRCSTVYGVNNTAKTI
ncbi:uncharacterized protein BDW70DRAFT_153935 [Aspergillus foveolatus]|uniref:uncharacterized protein n=1 Tax=Aspergillus foveolatus TaxID=210207 RepID=UPI003CCE2008